MKEQLRYQAYHDSLTRLPNRSLFTERVGEVLASGFADTTVLFVDLDDFKTINDTLGHGAGDDLLVAVAERVRACVRPGDLAARLGGDEFGILLERATDDAAEQIASRLGEALRAPFVLHGLEMQVHASIGIASGLYGARTADELLAQRRRRDVQREGRREAALRDLRAAHAHTCPPAARSARRWSMRSTATRSPSTSSRSSLSPEGVRSRSRRLPAGRHPTRGLVLPGGFIPLAEERGLMVRIGQDGAARGRAHAPRSGRRKFPEHASLGIAVNLSPSELQNPHLIHEVEAVLEETGLAPTSLIVEITESGAMADPAATLATLRDLRRLGVRLALDDFGTGYSSFGHLRDFPIDILKVAKPFIDHLKHARADVTFLDRIIRLADASSSTVVAEGVERPEQAWSCSGAWRARSARLPLRPPADGGGRGGLPRHHRAHRDAAARPSAPAFRR